MNSPSEENSNDLTFLCFVLINLHSPSVGTIKLHQTVVIKVLLHMIPSSEVLESLLYILNPYKPIFGFLSVMFLLFGGWYSEIDERAP